MRTVPIEQAEGHLGEILDQLAPGEEIVLTRDGIPVATTRKLRPLGTLKGSVLYIAPDFDDIPEGFEEYLP
jgi:antitoxin (DNA-binding transcriptional repressor) of toxin-antitoxin stability system